MPYYLGRANVELLTVTRSRQAASCETPRLGGQRRKRHPANARPIEELWMQDTVTVMGAGYSAYIVLPPLIVRNDSLCPHYARQGFS